MLAKIKTTRSHLAAIFFNFENRGNLRKMLLIQRTKCVFIWLQESLRLYKTFGTLIRVFNYLWVFQTLQVNNLLEKMALYGPLICTYKNGTNQDTNVHGVLVPQLLSHQSKFMLAYPLKTGWVTKSHHKVFGL